MTKEQTSKVSRKAIPTTGRNLGGVVKKNYFDH